MKRFSINKLTALLLAVVFIASCRGLQDMADEADKINYDVKPSPLEMHAEKVKFTVNGRFPAEYFNKKVTVTGTPVLQYDGKTKELKKITLRGEDVASNEGTQIGWDNGGTFNYQEEFDYEEDMRLSELILQLEVSDGEQTIQLGEEKKLADGIITTPHLVEKGLAVDNEAAGYESGTNYPSLAKVSVELAPTTTDIYRSDIHYVIQQSNVRRSEKRKEDVQGMLDKIKKAVEDELVFKGVDISSYASPDGPYEKINEPLSDNRGSSAKKFLDREMKRANLKDEDGSFNVEATPEDWEGFKELVEASDIVDKNLILRVLNMYDDVEKREEEIKKLAEAFEVLKDDILPELRRSRMAANFEIQRRTDNEILTLVNEDPSKLSKTEMLYAATLPENLNRQIRIYDKMIEAHPNDWRPYNNKGVVLVHQNKSDQAKEMFEQANGLQENEMTQNNLGAIAFMNKNYEEAASYFDNAAQSGSKEAAYNRGVIHIMDAEYQEAVDQFGTQNSFNAALAQLLNGDVNDAESTINAVNSDNAWVDYLQAIVGARQNDQDKVTSNLSSAVKKNSSLKEYARNDVEFGRYFESGAFTSIVE